MRIMKLSEQTKVLDALANNHFNADAMCFDAVCYGSTQSVIKYREEREYIWKVIQSFPPDIIKEYNASLRKIEADKLRAQADAIEKGAK